MVQNFNSRPVHLAHLWVVHFPIDPTDAGGVFCVEKATCLATTLPWRIDLYHCVLPRSYFLCHWF
jgi:hypothetical protein